MSDPATLTPAATAEPQRVDAADGGASRVNAPALRRDARRERILLFGLSLPALLLITIVMALPVVWLFGLSFVADDGTLTLEHYRRLVEQPSYGRTFLATFEISLVTTALCVLLGYPLAYVLAQLPPRAANL